LNEDAEIWEHLATCPSQINPLPIDKLAQRVELLEEQLRAHSVLLEQYMKRLINLFDVRGSVMPELQRDAKGRFASLQDDPEPVCWED
jgi:hypothetical protein